MIRVIRVVIIGAAVLITFLAFFGIRDSSRSPYTGIQHHNLVFQDFRRDSPNTDLALQPGDKFLSVDGIVPRNLNHFNFLTYSNVDLKPQVYRVSRGDS
ncbi:MAG: hypothetical protein KAX38_04940, partial [Candidatus Krumholzibacteria bacterium]|nr:hypothetical protein [Candidatus Krumholzibacteria bacterium]